jgi:hypothetical protein
MLSLADNTVNNHDDNEREKSINLFALTIIKHVNTYELLVCHH